MYYPGKDRLATVHIFNGALPDQRILASCFFNEMDIVEANVKKKLKTMWVQVGCDMWTNSFYPLIENFATIKYTRPRVPEEEIYKVAIFKGADKAGIVEVGRVKLRSSERIPVDYRVHPLRKSGTMKYHDIMITRYKFLLKVNPSTNLSTESSIICSVREEKLQ